MRTDVSKKFAIDFRASLDKANGERPRDGSGRFGVDREGRGKAREEAKMGTGEARDQIRDLKNQGKSEEAHALDDHLRRMSNRLGEARARMLPDTMHLHGIRPPVPAKRTMFERPEIIVPKEDPVAKEGTSEGAKLGWETRREGEAPEAGKPEEKPKDPVTEPEKPGRPEYYDRGAKAEESMRQLYRAKEATAKEVHDVAAQMLDVGEKYLADTKKMVVEVEQEFTSRGKEMRGIAKKIFESAKGDLRRGDSLLEEGKKQLDDLKKMDPAKKIDVYDHAGSTDLPWRAAGQAHTYLAAVRSYAPKPKVKKNASEEDEDAETEGEPSRRRPLPAEARAVMPVGTKKPPRPPGPPQPKQMRVGPRKIEGPRLMPVTTPRNPTYVGLDR